MDGLGKALVFLLLVVSSKAQPCDYSELQWSSRDGKIWLNDAEVLHLKGVNWFGFETETHAPHGLWAFPLSHFLDFLVKYHFNVLRLPFSVKFVLENPRDVVVDCSANPELCHLSALDLMQAVIDECGRRGILILLDQHRLSNGGIAELWYDTEYDEEKILESWEILMNRFARKWNLLGLDLKNEPHGQATWGKSAPTTDWNKAAERIITHIASLYPEFKGLFFVEGVASTGRTNSTTFWGEDLSGVRDHPIQTGDKDFDARVVYSPHVYGPGVFKQHYFSHPDFPENLAGIWSEHFGFVESATGRAVVVGEWGRTNSEEDGQWADAFAEYLVERCLGDNFFWCLNPNSGDTGGLLKSDWLSPEEEKLNLLAKVQPNPSKLYQDEDGKFCFYSGRPANPKCNNKRRPTSSVFAPPATITTTTAAATITTTTAAAAAAAPVWKVTFKGRKLSSWVEANGKKVAQIDVLLTNADSRPICGGSEIQMFPPDVAVRSKWNLEDGGRPGLYKVPSWFYLNPGDHTAMFGMILITHSIPEFRFVKIITDC